MPNWCEGTLRLKGKFANLKRFLTQGLQAVDFMGNQVNNGYRIATDEERYLWITDIKRNLYIKESRRHFVLGNGDIELYTQNMNYNITLALPIKAAWQLDSEIFEKISKAYNLDIRIHGYERGAEFEQIIEVIKGRIKRNEVIEHKDYLWDCECPLIGG